MSVFTELQKAYDMQSPDSSTLDDAVNDRVTMLEYELFTIKESKQLPAFFDEFVEGFRFLAVMTIVCAGKMSEEMRERLTDIAYQQIIGEENLYRPY